LSAARDPMKALSVRSDVKAAAKMLEQITNQGEKCSALLYLAQAQIATGKADDAAEALRQAEGLMSSVVSPFDRAVLLGRAARLYNDAKDVQRCERTLARAEAEVWRGLALGSLWECQAWGSQRIVKELNASIQEVNEEDQVGAIRQFSRMAIQLRDASRTVRRIQKQVSEVRKLLGLADYFVETAGSR